MLRKLRVRSVGLGQSSRYFGGTSPTRAYVAVIKNLVGVRVEVSFGIAGG